METKATPYAHMTTQQKVKFVFRLAVCIITFGFIFPNVMGD